MWHWVEHRAALGLNFMQFSAINHDILHSLFLENHLKLPGIAHTSYLVGPCCLVWVLAFHFVCKWASQKVRKMSSGTTLGKNWVGVSLGCWERTSVNRQLTHPGASRKKREREDKNSRVKVPRQSGRPCCNFLLQFAQDKMLNDYRIKGHARLTHALAWPGPEQRISQQTNHGRGRPGRGPRSARPALCHDSKRILQDASLIFSYLKTVCAAQHVTYTVLALDSPPWPIELVSVSRDWHWHYTLRQ